MSVLNYFSLLNSYTKFFLFYVYSMLSYFTPMLNPYLIKMVLRKYLTIINPSTATHARAYESQSLTVKHEIRKMRISYQA